MNTIRLMDQVRSTLRVHHYSLRTEESYLYWIRRFILFHGKQHPKDMGKDEITEFLSDLAIRKNVAASTQNQALSAILFLYEKVLDIEPGWIDHVVRAKKPRRLPVVLSFKITELLF
jgi:site-specific recombinase XerD